MTARSWAHGFVLQLLEMAHQSWLRCNNTRHDQLEGQGTETEEHDKENQAREQFVEGTAGLHPDDQWLTEDDLSESVLRCRPID